MFIMFRTCSYRRGMNNVSFLLAQVQNCGGGVAEGRQGGPPDDWLTVVAMGTVATFPRARRRSARANTVVSRDRSCVVAPLGG